MCQHAASWPGWTLFPGGGSAYPRGTRGVPMACSIPQSEQFSSSQTLDRGFLLQKNYKSDKIKVIFIWEVKSELPARNWAFGLLHHFCCSLGWCRQPVGCESRHYPHHHHTQSSICTSLNAAQALPSPSQPG